MTRGRVLLIGLAVLALGGVGLLGFRAAGLEGFSAGIAAQALLVIIWTGSYLFRVVTGNMTFMEQRRRYRAVYDEQTTQDLEARFDALPEAEQQELLRRIGADEDKSTADS